MQVEVVYLCWNCGSKFIKIEEVDIKLHLPYVERWNVCPDCLDKSKEKKRIQPIT